MLCSGEYSSSCDLFTFQDLCGSFWCTGASIQHYPHGFLQQDDPRKKDSKIPKFPSKSTRPARKHIYLTLRVSPTLVSLQSLNRLDRLFHFRPTQQPMIGLLGGWLRSSRITVGVSQGWSDPRSSECPTSLQHLYQTLKGPPWDIKIFGGPGCLILNSWTEIQGKSREFQNGCRRPSWIL